MSKEGSVNSPRDNSKIGDSQLESSRSEDSSEEEVEVRSKTLVKSKKETSSRKSKSQTPQTKNEERKSKTREAEEEPMDVDEDPKVKPGPSEANEVKTEADSPKVKEEENLSDSEDFEVVNKSDCENHHENNFDADILFDEPEPDEQFLVEKRLPKEKHNKELRDACFLYANSKTKSVTKATKRAFKMQLSATAKFPHLELPPPKNLKPRKWIKRTHIRHDGMQQTIWEREADAFINNTATIQRNEDHKKILTLTDDEYNVYFRKLDLEQIPSDDASLDDSKAWPKEIADSKRPWTLEETRYLISMYNRYTTRWPVIVDQYNFKGLQRSLFETKSRFFFIFDLMCFVRDKRHFMSDFDSDIEFIERKKLESDLKIHPDIHKQIAHLEKELMQTSPSDLEPQPRIPTAVELQPGPIQKSLTTARSSSSVPPSRMPSVPKIATRVNLEQTIDYEKKIEAALDVSVLRFFNNQTAGPHLRSQEYKLVSNVNPKKRANIENVIESLGLLRKCAFNEEIIKAYIKISNNVNIISELKAVYNLAAAECMSLHNEYGDKAEDKSKFELPPMPQTREDGRPTICSLAETPGQNAFNRKRGV